MAFTSAIVKQNNRGNKRVVEGTYTSDGSSTGGDVDTGLELVQEFRMQSKGGTAVGDQPTLNEALIAQGLDGSAITIKTTANDVGTWVAEGY